MAIKINSLSSRNLQGLTGGSAVEQTDDSAESSQGGAARGDSVSLTSTAAQLQQLESRILSMPVVDARLVEEVQRQLATGNFIVDPESSASKLLTLEKALP